MKLAAIDIGSNAARLQITNVTNYEGITNFKKLEYIRYPLRLGEDVFSYKEIGDAKIKKFIKLIQSFKILIELYEVDHVYSCATSAMREAANGSTIVDRIYQDTGLKIDIISGTEEADMINRVISFHLSDEYDFLHIDVGGGSTELNLYQNRSIVASQSFDIGSLRLLKQDVNEQSWNIMRDWIKEHVHGTGQEVLAIGTGGNINKLFDLAEGIKGEYLSIKKIERLKESLMKMSLEERLYKLQLNADRADVIIPASKIYLYAMREAGANKILVPDVGLKDGIMNYLYEHNVTQVLKS